MAFMAIREGLQDFMTDMLLEKSKGLDIDYMLRVMGISDVGYFLGRMATDGHIAIQDESESNDYSLKRDLEWIDDVMTGCGMSARDEEQRFCVVGSHYLRYITQN